MEEQILGLIANVNWLEYETKVALAVQKAVVHYNSMLVLDHKEKDRKEIVYQVSIWTDLQSATSAINFETEEHAKAFVSKWAAYWRDEDEFEVADELEENGYTTNPANFKYTRFLLIDHPELLALQEASCMNDDIKILAEKKIEESLLKVEEKLIFNRLLRGLPTHNHTWIGINSPTDWYTHVRKY